MFVLNFFSGVSNWKFLVLVSDLEKKDTFWHWEWGPISAPKRNTGDGTVYLLILCLIASSFLSKFDIQSAGVTLKMRSRSPKSNHFFPMPQWCFCANLVKIHPSVQEIRVQTMLIFSLYTVATLKIRLWSSKCNKIF